MWKSQQYYFTVLFHEYVTLWLSTHNNLDCLGISESIILHSYINNIRLIIQDE